MTIRVRGGTRLTPNEPLQWPMTCQMRHGADGRATGRPAASSRIRYGTSQPTGTDSMAGTSISPASRPRTTRHPASTASYLWRSGWAPQKTQLGPSRLLSRPSDSRGTSMPSDAIHLRPIPSVCFSVGAVSISPEFLTGLEARDSATDGRSIGALPLARSLSSSVPWIAPWR